MKNKRDVLYSLILLMSGVLNFSMQAQQKKDAREIVELKDASDTNGPNGIVRTIRQDRKGTVWIASWEGVFKYDGKSFTNVTREVSPARFFTLLEDRKGNFWFASVGSGLYYYDGKTFRNFTTKDGLASDGVGDMYEDKSGTMWFATGNGLSSYDGKTFRNRKINEAPAVSQSDSIYTGTETKTAKAGDSVHVSFYQNPLPKIHWTHNDAGTIIEDDTGKIWVGTRGHAVIYDGITFTTIQNDNGKPFVNVRSIIKDRKGNIWLGGDDGLWRYDGRTFTNFTKKFVGYIIEDKKGNIWTSSGTPDTSWALSRYDGKTLDAATPTVTEITTRPVIFGILEDDKGNIWFGDYDGVHFYDGKTITDFKDKKGWY